MVKFRFFVSRKCETSYQPEMVTVQFGASQQENFGKFTPSVTFETTMVRAAADRFVLGKEYYFTAEEVAQGA
jgi:hypothetical protein